jgi:hypothetical protein
MFGHNRLLQCLLNVILYCIKNLRIYHILIVIIILIIYTASTKLDDTRGAQIETPMSSPKMARIEAETCCSKK